MSNFNNIDRAAMDGYEAYASGATMPARYAADDLLASSWRVGRRQAEESAARDSQESLDRDERAESIAQADAYLNNVGLPGLALQISVRSNYGAPAIYPANEAARIFADIAGTKTLKVDTLAKAKRLGFRIERIGDSIDVPGLADLY